MVLLDGEYQVGGRILDESKSPRICCSTERMTVMIVGAWESRSTTQKKNVNECCGKGQAATNTNGKWRRGMTSSGNRRFTPNKHERNKQEE